MIDVQIIVCDGASLVELPEVPRVGDSVVWSMRDGREVSCKVTAVRWIFKEADSGAVFLFPEITLDDG